MRNGEIDLARRVVSSAPSGSPLIVIDVGANVGDWIRPVLDALPAHRLDTSRTRFFAFEPAPQTRGLLVENIAAHARSALVTIEHRALSNERGEAQMMTFGAEAGTHTLGVGTHACGSASEAVTVEVTTLAEFAGEQGLGHIDLVKIDTEGFDRLVLEGMQPLLAEERISVAQFEYNHRWVATRSFFKDVFDMVEGLPYSVARLMPDHVEVIEQWHPEVERFFEANYAVVRHADLPRLDARRGCFDGSNTYA
ncbi:FkbM family methyltransferase [Rhodoblastus sphagnicola]|nr:FkbM family methyltransferase [Rhodoblastus sphagnicola]MBB4200276.1 FkbM family methyltransferase [Rhodoblastus sphagnicola]